MGVVLTFPRAAVARATAGTTPRWRALATYRSEDGPVTAEWKLEELDDLAELLEHGPDFRCVVEVRIVPNRVMPGEENLTLEEAARL